MLYGSVTWTIKARDARRIADAEMKYMRRTAGYTLTDYKTSTQITKKLKITPILDKLLDYKKNWIQHVNTRVGTLIVATIYLQLIQNRYMFRSFTVLQCSHQHCVQPVASDVEFVGYL